MILVNHLNDKINKASENIPSFFILRTIISLANPISLIFNCPLALSVVTRQWKISFVIPLIKKGSKNKPFNYRPISLTRSFAEFFNILYL